MLDLNNSCTTLTEYEYSKHNSQYIHSQHNTTKNTIQHKTYAGLNALAVVQTLSTTYMAQCTGSSTNKKCMTCNT